MPDDQKALTTRWLKRPHWLELRFLGVVCGAASMLWIFIELADEVVEGSTRGHDLALLMALRSPGDASDPIGPRWLEQLARDLTALGSPGVLTLLVCVACLFLLLSRKWRTFLLVLGATASGGIATRLLKLTFDRPRPELIPHDIYISTASFPSGHAMGATFVYLTLGALLAQLVPERKLKLYVLSVAATLAGLVGLSRVYLGVHWPSDVIAGWAAGAFWAMMWWLLARLVKRDAA